MTTPQQETSEEQVLLLEERSLNQMGKWYDQQIMLAKKSSQLSSLKADIAQSRVKETYALVELARLTAPPSDNDNEPGSDRQVADPEQKQADPDVKG